ncbi:hypothetical protein [Mesorhizobium sp.]|uniref:hypothetical protein n=1 Tax=Mesorhizobium sp. TaxID=1871066 RepID=UPI00257C7AAC|nr:hypothetical protein [Mesorhizobium sp.]
MFEVNDAATILLRDLHRQTEKRKIAMDACLQVLRGEAHRQPLGVPSSQPRSKQRFCAAIES